MSEANRVLLVRSPRPDDPFERALRGAGFDAVSVPVLRFAFVQEAVLRARLAQPERYGGLLVTSPRTAEALERVGVPAAWQQRRVFAVGPRTAEALRQLGLRPEGAETGSADVLARYLLAQPPAAPLLFLAGDRRRDTLPEALRAAGLAFDEVTVYRTLPDADLGPFIAEPPGWLVFFSPSGVEAVDEGGLALARFRLAAIGATTAAALAERGLPVAAVAASPTPAALAAALREERRGQEERPDGP